MTGKQEMDLSEDDIQEARGIIVQIARALANINGRVLVCGHSGDSGARFLAQNGLEVHRVKPGIGGDFHDSYAGVTRKHGSLEPVNWTDAASSMYEAVIAILRDDEYMVLPPAFFARLRRAVRPGGLIGIAVKGSDTGNLRIDRTPLLVEVAGYSIEYARTASETQNEWSVIFRKPMSQA